MNAIFAVEVRQESDFACHAIRLPLCNASFFSFGRTATDFLPPRFGNVSSSMRDREIGCAPSTRGPEGRIYPSGVAFRPFFSHFIPFPLLCSTPTPLYFLGFPLSFSISSIYGNVNRRNGLIGFISRSRCPQFQFSRACVFSVSVEIRSVYSG